MNVILPLPTHVMFFTLYTCPTMAQLFEAFITQFVFAVGVQPSSDM